MSKGSDTCKYCSLSDTGVFTEEHCLSSFVADRPRETLQKQEQVATKEAG
jgi:hypothetical protein